MVNKHISTKGAKTRAWKPSDENWGEIYQYLYTETKYRFKELDSHGKEELASEAFEAGFGKFKLQFDPPSGSDEKKLAYLKKWFLRIMTNLKYDEYRKQGRERDYQDSVTRPGESNPVLPQMESNFEDKAMVEQLIEDIKNHLPPEQYDVFQLKIQGFTFKEIGAELKINPSTADTRYYKAMNNIDDMIKPLRGYYKK